MGTFLSILKAIPGLISLINKITEAWGTYKIKRIESKTQKKKEEIRKLTTQLKKAKTDEDRRRFLRNLDKL